MEIIISGEIIIDLSRAVLKRQVQRWLQMYNDIRLRTIIEYGELLTIGLMLKIYGDEAIHLFRMKIDSDHVRHDIMCHIGLNGKRLEIYWV